MQRVSLRLPKPRATGGAATGLRGVVRLSSERASQAVRQDCSLSKKQERLRGARRAFAPRSGVLVLACPGRLGGVFGR